MLLFWRRVSWRLYTGLAVLLQFECGPIPIFHTFSYARLRLAAIFKLISTRLCRPRCFRYKGTSRP